MGEARQGMARGTTLRLGDEAAGTDTVRRDMRHVWRHVQDDVLERSLPSAHRQLRASAHSHEAARRQEVVIPPEPKTTPSVRNAALEGMQRKRAPIVTEEAKVKRVPVDYDYQGLNLTYLKWMAKIVKYADEKYGAWSQYTKAELTGDKSPLNHIYEHMRQYQEGEPYDHFDGDPRWHLVAVGYNAMMSFYQHTRWGFKKHPLVIDEVQK
jgi:hypothetical protein